MKQENLNKMKTGAVADRARKAGIQGVENMNKEQMIQALGGKGAPPSTKAGRGGEHKPAPSGTKPQDWKNVPGNQS
ncbi:MAG TPA: hypothetical protein VFX61_06870 [Micromonosporaceae bacterium]|nr:hypothetical protein [Micromonosporaceae bacterium]